MHRPHWSRLQFLKLTSMEDLRKPQIRAAVLDIVMKKRKKRREMCREASLIWGLLRCCQTTVTPRKTIGESADTMPPLPPVSWFKETRTSRRAKVRCVKCLKPRKSNDRRDEESPFFLSLGREAGSLSHVAAIGPLETVCTELFLRCKRLLFCDFPCLPCVPQIGCFRSNCADCSPGV